MSARARCAVAALPHFLERVGSWNGCHRADPRACPRDHGVDGAATHKGASGVVYEDEARLGSECLESGADGVHALRTTCNESEPVAAEFGEPLRGAIGIAGREDDDDLAHFRM